MDLLDAGLARTDRSTGTIYANSSQGPIPIGVDQPAAALAQIVQSRNETDASNDAASHAGPNAGNDNGGHPAALDPTNARARLAQIEKQKLSYGGVPQGLETRIAALQTGLHGTAPHDPGTQSARQGLARAQTELAQWKQDHPDYAALNREQSDLWASDAIVQRFARENIKGCVFEPPESIHP